LNNPILQIGESGTWDDALIWKPYVLQDTTDATYYMWYTAHRNGSIIRQGGLATFSNGVDWIKYDDPNTTSVLYAYSDPVLKPSPGQWDASYVQIGSVLLLGDSLHMWYDGSISPASTNLWKIGHATLHIDTLRKYTDIRHTKPIQLLYRYVLHQNYPNPFNPTTTIEFDLPKSSEISLKIFNILGEEVATLVSDRLSVGSYSYEWDASNHASGVYLYRLQVGDPSQGVGQGYVETRKMVLMR
jgi:hypothetical protein